MFSGITSSLKNIGSKAESLFESKKNDAGEMAKDTEAEGARVLDETQEAVKSKAKDTKDGVDKFVNDTANKAK